jgi:hypothetical protein
MTQKRAKFHIVENGAHDLSVARRFDNSTAMNIRHAAALAIVGW